jgi:uncharacterized membrane protein
LQSLLNFGHHGTTFDWPERRPHLTVHDSWALLVLTPLVLAFPRPETFIVVQVAAIAAAALVLYQFARGCGLGERPAQLLALAFLISPSAHGRAYMDFSENVFVPLVAFSLALGRAAPFPARHAGAGSAPHGRERRSDLFLAWLGLAGALWYDRRLDLSVLALVIVNGIAYYVLVLHSGFAPVHPRYSLHVRYWFQDTAFLAEVLAPFALAPLVLGWRLLLVAPLVAEMTMDRAWNYPMARAGTHYTVPLVTLMAIGAAIAMARRPKLAAYAVACSCVMALFFNVTVLHFGRHLYPPDRAGYAQARAVALSARP